MRLLLLCVFILGFLSCTKDEKLINIDAFLNKTLVCKQLVKITDGVQTIEVKGKGTGYDLRLTKGNYTLYSNPVVVLRCSIASAKIYIWPKDKSIYDGDYLNIAGAQDKDLQLEHIDVTTKNSVKYFYTIE